jgi:hypothetical protein
MIGVAGVSGMGGPRSRRTSHKGAERAENVRLPHPDINQHGGDQDEADEDVHPMLRQTKDPRRDDVQLDSARIKGMTAAPAREPMTVP